MLNRSVNAGFSGGEKKRNEILQMAVLEPRLAILDETDSGLDIDALRIVADGVNKLKRPDNATIVVTHYQRLLNYIVPDFVHVLANGRIVKSGGKELALELEEKGYDWITGAGARRSGRVTDAVQYVEQFRKSRGERRAERRRSGCARCGSSALRAVHASSAFRPRRTRTGTSRAWRRSPNDSSCRSPRSAATCGGPTCEPYLFANTDDWHLAVFVNGRFAPELSHLEKLPDGVRVLPLARAWAEAPALAERVGTIAPHGQPVVHRAQHGVPPGRHRDPRAGGSRAGAPDPSGLRHRPARRNGVSYPRNLIVAERHSRATVIESYVGLGDVRVLHERRDRSGRGARARRSATTSCSARGEQAYHVGTVEVTQGRDSHYVSFSLATGARPVAHEHLAPCWTARGAAPRSTACTCSTARSTCDHQTRIEHAQPNCFSRELYKGVLDGESHGVFNGKVYVQPIAQKTDGKQTNNTLLLSARAQVDTKPQLEIFADDVKCTHGATVGRLDDVSLFYMKSRGIGRRGGPPAPDLRLRGRRARDDRERCRPGGTRSDESG